MARTFNEVLNGGKTFDEITKFNPYHGKDGRFTTAGGAFSFTIRTKDPSKQKWADAAAAREKERTAADGKKDKDEAAAKITAAENKLKSILKEGTEVNLKGFDPDLAEETVKSIQMVLDKYPSVKDAFKGFVTDDTDENTFTEKKGVMGCYDPATGKIHLNPAYYGDKSNFENRYKESVKNKFHPEGTDYNSVVIHEMGHAIDRYVSVANFGAYKVNWMGETVSRRAWNNAISKGKKSGDPLTGKKIMEGLSGYATKSPAEYLAEGFAEFMTSTNPRPMAKSVGKSVEMYIKKAAKAGGA